MQNHRRIVSSLSLFGLLALAVEGCKAPCGEVGDCGPAYIPPEGGAGGEAGTSGVSGAGGRGGEAGSGGGCDTTQSPADEPCLVSDEHAVFVAPAGSDDATGTMDAPVQTIAKGLELAAASQGRVIVCDATYAEAVTVTAGLQLFGGFACPDTATPWARTDGQAAVAPPEPGYALAIRDVTAPVVVEDVAFTAVDATEAGGSSIAAFVVNAPSVTLRRVQLVAGRGADGASGVNAGFVFPTVEELQGNDAAGDDGAARKVCSCPGEVSTTGGGGGDAPDQGGGSGAPAHNETAGRGGDNGATCDAGGTGSPGAAGPSASDAAAVATLGTLTETGWQPTSGATAQNGSPGQGGGGGAGRPAGGGGSGGCGGCGGQGGPGGQAGGASIALLAFNSPVQLLESSLQTAEAGDGGSGATGQQGQQAFGAGGIGFGAGDRGCPGGNGGIGGDGGSGSGAAGGVSVGILFSGEAPIRMETSVTVGAAGLKGLGGEPQVNDGVDGIAQEELKL